jgi:hypothetical protein
LGQDSTRSDSGVACASARECPPGLRPDLLRSGIRVEHRRSVEALHEAERSRDEWRHAGCVWMEGIHQDHVCLRKYLRPHRREQAATLVQPALNPIADSFVILNIRGAFRQRLDLRPAEYVVGRSLRRATGQVSQCDQHRETSLRSEVHNRSAWRRVPSAVLDRAYAVERSLSRTG